VFSVREQALAGWPQHSDALIADLLAHRGMLA
jgi:hypothetical protein